MLCTCKDSLFDMYNSLEYIVLAILVTHDLLDNNCEINWANREFWRLIYKVSTLAIQRIRAYSIHSPILANTNDTSNDKLLQILPFFVFYFLSSYV